MKTDSEYMSELQVLINGPHNFLSNLSTCKKFAELKHWIINKTNLLLDDNFYTLGNRIFYLINGFTELPQCANPNCQNKVKINFTVYTDKNQYYHVHCCRRCVQLDPNIKIKIENTTFKKYNCKRGFNNTKSLKKRKESYFIKTGYYTPLENPDVLKKCNNTLKDRYGVDTPFKIPGMYNHIKETIQKKYGVDYISQNSDIKNKIKQTNIQKYGCEYPMQSDSIRSKIENTMLNRYGSTPYLGTEQCLNKTHQKCLEKYGVDHISQVQSIRKKIEKTNLYRYGNIAGKTFNSDSVRHTMKERYGNEHSSQCKEIQLKMHKKYIYNGIYFASSVEIAFYIWLNDIKDILDIDFIYQPQIRFEYIVNNKRHFYNPDFWINGVLFEIKGDQFFKDGKMINPYRNKEWTDEQYQHICDIYETKYQCMLKNNIVIITSDTYNFFINYVKQNYGKNYLKQFKNNQKSKL